MSNISFIGSSSYRTYFYLKAIKNAKIDLKSIQIYNYKKLDISLYKNQKIEYKGLCITIDESLESLLDYFNAEIIEKNSINDLTHELHESKDHIYIFSGKSGEIVKEDILEKGLFLHVHPGRLPQYRGSTTIYYSLLQEKACCATAFFLDTKIDTGEVIKEMSFGVLDIDFDYLYDPFIRTYLLINVLQSHNFNTKKQENNKAKEYYIIHPVLKKLALIKKQKLHR